MALLDQVQALVSGTSHLDLQAVRSQIGFAEQQTPEGTPVELRFDFQGPVTVGGVEIPLAQYAASFLNDAMAAGHLVIQGEQIRPWQGEQQIASYNGSATTVHWIHGQVFSPLIIGLLVGAAILGGIVLYLYLKGWSFGKLVQVTAQTPVAGLPVEDWLLAAAVLFIGIPVVRRL